MIGNHYKKQKEAVFNIFERYLINRGNQNDGIDLEILHKRIKNLKDDKFILAIVGEVKAGKSTFINALLGDYILPTDVLQNTRAIIEIYKSSTKIIHVIYGNGKEQNYAINNLEDARKLLHSLAAVQDKYRSLPSVQLDDYLIDVNGQLYEKDVEDFLNTLENPHSINKDEFINLSKAYLYEFKSLEKIPVEIKVGYPLKYDFDELRIIDSPGVNARGGIQERTFEFINKANAVLFVHKNSVESTSFRQFFNKAIIERNKDTLFLILTHMSHHTNENIEKLTKETRKLYPEIASERIIPIDSKLWLIYNKLKNGFSFDDVMDDSEEDGMLISPFIIKAKGDDEKLKNSIKIKSNFEYMEKMIDSFSLHAPLIQLSEIVQRIRDGYSNLETFVSQEIKVLNYAKKSPQEFENQINLIQNTLDNYKLKLNKFSEEVVSKYHYTSGEISTEIGYNFSLEISNCSDETDLKRAIINFNDKCNENIKIVSNKIKKEFENELSRLGKQFKDEFNLSVPKINLENVAEKAKKNSYTTIKETVKDNVTQRTAGGGGLGALLGGIAGFMLGGPVGAAIGVGLGGGTGAGVGYKTSGREYKTRTEFDQQKYIQNLKDEASILIDRLISEIPQEISKMILSYKDTFKKEMLVLIEERKSILQDIKEKKLENENLLKEIKKNEGKKKDLEIELQKIDNIIVNLV